MRQIDQRDRLPLKVKFFHYASWFEASWFCDQLRTSFEPASVMEFGFKFVTLQLLLAHECRKQRKLTRNVLVENS